MTLQISPAAKSELAPSGLLRAGINLGNFLLVTSREANGDPAGIAPDMACALAASAGVPVKLLPYPSPGALSESAGSGVWDVAFLGAEPARAKEIDFSAAYVEIDAGYLVPAGSTLKTIDEVDSKGVRIAVSARSAYDLYLTRSLKNAELVRVEGIDAAYQHFAKEKLDALAGLKPGLIANAETLPGSRVLEGRFTAVQQAAGVPAGRSLAAAYLKQFIEHAKASGLVASLMEKHGVKELSVAAGV
ncbi:MAG: transporter substrate-binding domain-containing protein [Burkholderiales bacterium]